VNNVPFILVRSKRGFSRTFRLNALWNLRTLDLEMRSIQLGSPNDFVIFQQISRENKKQENSINLPISQNIHLDISRYQQHQPTLKMSPVPSEPTPSPRLFYLDNFRTYLTALVMYHHTSLLYGGIGAWPYSSRFHTPGSSPTLISFNAINQPYFTDSFFFLSRRCHFLPLIRKDAGNF
jgi:hypothetical protein